MRMKKVLLIAQFALCTGGALHAQVTYDYLKAADNYYAKGDYYSAAQYYEKYLGAGKDQINKNEYDPYSVQSKTAKASKVAVSNRHQAVYKAAEAYRLLNYPAKAEPFYKQVISFDSTGTEFPLAKYWYGKTLRALERYEEAEAAFSSFLTTYSTADKYNDNAKVEVKSLAFIQKELKKKELKFFTINPLVAVNGAGGNSAPVLLNDNTLLFTSARPEKDAATKNYVNKIYQASYSDSSVGSVVKADIPALANVHQGAVSVTPDGNTIFLTRWSIDKDGKRASSIYKSTKNGNSWGEPVALDASINVAGVNNQQPFVMPDGKTLVFSSNREGGFGGFDLWAATLDASGNASNPVNLGESINTTFDEQAPYYHNPSGTLVFATNGRVGMGGFDLFSSKGTLGNWATPENLGYPVNSVKDDIYFASKGPARNMLGEVILSSDRNSACCLDLFVLHKEKPLKKISGTVIACENGQPVNNAVVKVVDGSNQTIYTKTTGSDGAYNFTLEEFMPLTAYASAAGYNDTTLAFNNPGDADEEFLSNPAICLTKPLPPPPPVDTIIVMNNVYYAFDKATLKTESYPALDEVVDMLNKYSNLVIEIGGHTDDKGSDKYNQKLSQARAQSCVDYLISKGIAKDRLVAKGYGESMPIADNSTPEGQQKNRRTEFKVLKN